MSQFNIRSGWTRFRSRNRVLLTLALGFLLVSSIQAQPSTPFGSSVYQGSVIDTAQTTPPIVNASSRSELISAGGSSLGQDCDSCPPARCFNLLKPSDHCFDQMISPMTNPLFFEDPRTLTEARAIFANHNVPAAAGGGSVQLFALQMRFALSDRLSLIATKDGYMTSSNPLIQDGFADVSAGFKLNLLRDPELQRIFSVGFTYDIPVGSTRTLQGNGDGEFNLFYSSARRVSQNVNWISGGGIRLAVDSNAESSSTYSSNHLAFQMTQRFYLLTEVNWFHWIDSGGNAALAGVEGHDLFNFGSTNVDGNNIVTAAIGGKYKASRHSEMGVAFEVPVTSRQDITSSRLTVDMIFRY